MSGARKEDAAIKRLLTAEDLGKLDSATAYEKTNKKNVLGEYNPTADKESGTSAGVVYMRKALFSAIPSKPSEDSSEARRKYVEQLPKIWGAILEINTLSALKDYGRSRFMSSWTSSGKIYDNQADDGARFDASDALGKKFMNLLRRASTSATAIWNEAEKCESHTTEQVDEMYEKYKKNQEITMKRLLDDMGETPKPEFRDYVAVQLKRLTGKKPVGEALELEVNRLHRLRVE